MKEYVKLHRINYDNMVQAIKEFKQQKFKIEIKRNNSLFYEVFYYSNKEDCFEDLEKIMKETIEKTNKERIKLLEDYSIIRKKWWFKLFGRNYK